MSNSNDERILCSICDHRPPEWLVHRDILDIAPDEHELEEAETSVICDQCWRTYFQSKTMVSQRCVHCGAISVATCVPLTGEMLEAWRGAHAED